MCRFAAYFGNKQILLEEVLSKPENSLIRQSLATKEGTHEVNADGFGIAWYDFSIDSSPGVFKSTHPAWSDNNLIHLSRKIRSNWFLSHVRASTVGNVSQNNCHPFCFEDYSFVHNGTILNFSSYKKALIAELPEKLFLNIQGQTDSEHLFYLIMHFIEQGHNIIEATKLAISWVTNAQSNSEDFSRINIAITNGVELLATRFVSKSQTPLSLQYCHGLNEDQTISSLFVSSEPLNDNTWNELPTNHALYLNKNDMMLQTIPL